MFLNRRRIITMSSICAAAMACTTASAYLGLAIPSHLISEAAVVKTNDQQLSHKFKNASAEDVIKWLESQNLNFVIDTSNLPKKQLTMSLKNADASDAIEAIAKALGMAWSKKGDVYVLSSAPRLRFANERLDRVREGRVLREVDEVRPLRQLREGRQLTPAQEAELRKELGSMEIELQETLGELGPKIALRIQEAMKAHQGEMSEEDRAKMEKGLQRMKIELGENMAELGPKIAMKIQEAMKNHGKELTPEQRAEMEEGLRDMRMELKEVGPEIEKAMKEMKLHMQDGKMSKEHKAEMEKHFKEMRVHLKEVGPEIERAMKEMKLHQKGDHKMSDKDRAEMEKELAKVRVHLKEMGPEIEKKIAEAMAQAMKAEGKEMTPEQRAKFEKKMAEMHKKLSEMGHKMELKFGGEGGHDFDFDFDFDGEEFKFGEMFFPHGFSFKSGDDHVFELDGDHEFEWQEKDGKKVIRKVIELDGKGLHEIKEGKHVIRLRAGDAHDHKVLHEIQEGGKLIRVHEGDASHSKVLRQLKEGNHEVIVLGEKGEGLHEIKVDGKDGNFKVIRIHAGDAHDNKVIKELKAKGGEFAIAVAPRSGAKADFEKKLAQIKDSNGKPVFIVQREAGTEGHTIRLKDGMTGYVVKKKANAPKVMKSIDGKVEVHIVKKAADGKPVVVGAKARTAKGAKAADLKTLVESLSAGQKEIMKERGYLKVSDLTVKQQSLLGDMAKGDGKFEVAFSAGKTKVRIKS